MTNIELEHRHLDRHANKQRRQKTTSHRHHRKKHNITSKILLQRYNCRGNLRKSAQNVAHIESHQTHVPHSLCPPSQRCEAPQEKRQQHPTAASQHFPAFILRPIQHDADDNVKYMKQRLWVTSYSEKRRPYRNLNTKIAISTCLIESNLFTRLRFPRTVRHNSGIYR